MYNEGQYDGHEIASHSYSHPRLDQITDEEFRNEMVDSKTFLEDFTGEAVDGLAYPYYYTADAAHLQVIKDAGYLYSRRTDPAGSFNIPESFYNWNPTQSVLYNGGVTGAAIRPAEYSD